MSTTATQLSATKTRPRRGAVSGEEHRPKQQDIMPTNPATTTDEPTTEAATQAPPSPDQRTKELFPEMPEAGVVPMGKEIMSVATFHERTAVKNYFGFGRLKERSDELNDIEKALSDYHAEKNTFDSTTLTERVKHFGALERLHDACVAYAKQFTKNPTRRRVVKNLLKQVNAQREALAGASSQKEAEKKITLECFSYVANYTKLMYAVYERHQQGLLATDEQKEEWLKYSSLATGDLQANLPIVEGGIDAAKEDPQRLRVFKIARMLAQLRVEELDNYQKSTTDTLMKSILDEVNSIKSNILVSVSTSPATYDLPDGRKVMTTRFANAISDSAVEKSTFGGVSYMGETLHEFTHLVVGKAFDRKDTRNFAGNITLAYMDKELKKITDEMARRAILSDRIKALVRSIGATGGPCDGGRFVYTARDFAYLDIKIGYATASKGEASRIAGDLDKTENKQKMYASMMATSEKKKKDQSSEAAKKALKAEIDADLARIAASLKEYGNLLNEYDSVINELYLYVLEGKKRRVTPPLTEDDPLYAAIRQAAQEAYDYRARARADYGT